MCQKRTFSAAAKMSLFDTSSAVASSVCCIVSPSVFRS